MEAPAIQEAPVATPAGSDDEEAQIRAMELAMRRSGVQMSILGLASQLNGALALATLAGALSPEQFAMCQSLALRLQSFIAAFAGAAEDRTPA